MKISFFYIPFGNHAEAISLGDLAVERKLAACANVFPIQSIFPWNDAIQHEQEYVLVLKTFPTMNMLLREFIEANHSYDTPGIVSWEADVNENYGNWMIANLKKD